MLTVNCLDRRAETRSDEGMIAQRNLYLTFWSLAAIVTIFPAISAASEAVDGRDVYGLWLTEDKTATVRIAGCGPGPMEGTPCGVVQTADIPEGEPTTDVNNADPALRDVPIIGLTMLDGFKASSSKWKSGRIYNPEDGKSYKSSIEREDQQTLKVKGCIAFLCQTQRWTLTGTAAEMSQTSD